MSTKVNPEMNRSHTHRRKKGGNAAFGKLNKFNVKSKAGGLQTWDVMKAIIEIVVFILVGFLFYGVFLNNLETSGGRDEYGCSTDLGDVEIPQQLLDGCKEADGWKRWDLIDSAYFVMVTITTVGYGDMGPISDRAKWFTVFFILVGIIVIAGALGIIGRFFMDQAAKRKQKKQKAMEEVAMKVGNQLKADVAATPKAADAPPTPLKSPSSPSKTGSRKMRAKSKEDSEITPGEAPTAEEIAFKKELSKVIDTGILSTEKVVRLLQGLLEEQKACMCLEVEEQVVTAVPGAVPRSSSVVKLPPLEDAHELEPGLDVGKIPLSAASKPPPVVTSAEQETDVDVKSPPVPQTPMDSFKAMYNDPEVRADVRKKFKLAWKINQCFYLVYLFMGLSFVLGHIEGWSPLDSFYYAVVTGTTVGYGDKSPATAAGRIFACFLLPLGVIGLSNAVGSISSVFEDEKQGASETLMDKVQELERIIAEDDDGTVTEEEFTIFQMKKIFHVDEETLKSVRNQFKSLDADGSGELDQDDIMQLKVTCKKMGIKATHGAITLFRRLSAHANPAKYGRQGAAAYQAPPEAVSPTSPGASA